MSLKSTREVIWFFRNDMLRSLCHSSSFCFCFCTWLEEDKIMYYQNFESDVPSKEDKTGQSHPDCWCVLQNLLPSESESIIACSHKSLQGFMYLMIRALAFCWPFLRSSSESSEIHNTSLGYQNAFPWVKRMMYHNKKKLTLKP